MKLTKYEADLMGIVIDANGRASIKRPAATQPKPTQPKDNAKRTLNLVTARGKSSDGRNPQIMIYDSLVPLLGAGEVVLEQKNLIHGRAFRADIYLPASKIVVEMDGFQYHRSKDAFQSDRIRQNLFVANGYSVLRYFASQVFKELDVVTKQIESLHLSRVALFKD